MATSKDLFGRESNINKNPVRPLEPLFSLLYESPVESVQYLLSNLQSYDSDDQLDDILPETGLTRYQYIEQILLALETREVQ